MDDFIIKKVLNNNVVIAQKNMEQFILVGKGLGFDSNKGIKIDSSRIESVFVKEVSGKTGNFEEILQKVNSEIVGISEEIISLCEKELEVKLSEGIHVSLPDHINFAMVRIEKGVKIENPFLYELVALYPKEYRLAEKALHMINSNLATNLPKDEIGFICMHIKAAINQEAVSTALAYTKKVREIMDLIAKLLKSEFNKDSLAYMRTITHLNFMIERISNNKTVKNYLLDSIKKDLYNQYDIAIKVAMKIENLFSVKVSEDEIGYIALHISRLTEF
ncbi:MAG: PRD domain-containing protein [Clostridiaceae bacterium]|nr:PRD domain-containing protein [Clostridiaceae bacterium]